MTINKVHILMYFIEILGFRNPGQFCTHTHNLILYWWNHDSEDKRDYALVERCEM